MIRLNIHEAKTHLSKYLALVEQGERILLCRHNKPVAELRPIDTPRQSPRPIGLAKGEFTVPEEFFKPLPEEDLNAFEEGLS